jgi:hypothetical protein
MRSKALSGSDLLILAPWILFGVGLFIVAIRLRKSRR